jgi:hypothetical protein
MAAFPLKAGQPDRLADAPGGKQHLTADEAEMTRGKTVFAETCARCHSSKLPKEARAQMEPGGCSGSGYLTCWNRYWAYTKTDEFKSKMREIVAEPDFLKDNYLSTEARVPVTLLRTNACSPLGTNAIGGNIWDNFSSSTYKALPKVGKITVQDPFTAERWQYPMPGGGLGFTRVPSLVSVWSTAPFLLNNRLGLSESSYYDTSVDARMNRFKTSIGQLLWPETRDHDENFDGVIVRTTERSFLNIPKRSVPVELKSLFDGLPAEPFRRVFDKDKSFRLGPIPKGFPIGLAASLQPSADRPARDKVAYLFNFGELVKSVVKNWPTLDLSADDAKLLAWTANLRGPLLKMSKCPDYVVNRGHYFGTEKFNETDGLSDDEKAFGPEKPLSDGDKRALIEFIKTF